jgi:hypothetical protein
LLLSNQAYGSIHLHVAYRDTDGKIIDVVNDEDNDLIVGLKSDGRFRDKAKSAADTLW